MPSGKPESTGNGNPAKTGFNATPTTFDAACSSQANNSFHDHEGERKLPTHDKTIYCSTCRLIGRIKQDWYRSRCRDCQSWGSSWLYFLLFHLMSQHRDDQKTLKHLNRRVNSILRWLLEELKPALSDSNKSITEETFLKLLTIVEK